MVEDFGINPLRFLMRTFSSFRLANIFSGSDKIYSKLYFLLFS